MGRDTPDKACLDWLAAQQVRVVSTVRLVAGRTALLKRRLVGVRLLGLLCLLGVAAQANGHRVWLGKARRVAGVRIVAVGAVTHRARMLNLGLLDLLGLLRVTGYAERLSVGLRQDDFAVLGGGMAGVTLPAGKRRMRELRH